MNQDELKKSVAEYTIEYIKNKLQADTILGIGTGSTVNYFIDLLASIKNEFEATVASSKETEDLLKSKGIAVYDLNAVSDIAFYIDGADEANSNLELIKGGGAALTREKIVLMFLNVQPHP